MLFARYKARIKFPKEYLSFPSQAVLTGLFLRLQRCWQRQTGGETRREDESHRGTLKYMYTLFFIVLYDFF